ncbi:hypothetical protein [Streptomyces paludis]|uniref:Uncharacterized protein n=1 Tax=Streptomyces paludis TaxID=2282738 RepID=A0A345HW32_9ACTN|nr:hypothetical protein [Streptomyces paludis]AXG80906.1 hypothetical protein DVK44_28200 [Streptomyces paludis]
MAGTEYVAMILIVAMISAAIVVLSVPQDTATGLKTAVCRVLHPLSGAEACSTGDLADDGDERDEGENGEDSGDGGDEGDGDDGPPVVPANDPFEPAKCLLSEDQTKDTVVIQILFIKISNAETVKIQQWSDGTVTLERVTDSGVGATASVSAGIPGLKDWGGSASLSASYMSGKGQGGQWLFAGHKSDDPQADLEANLEDAKAFATALRQMEGCRAIAGRGVSPIGQASCIDQARSKLQNTDPSRMPDVDITKSTTELSGGLSLGKSFTKGKDGEKLGSLSTELFNASMAEEVVVLRTRTGPSAGQITFVYTFSVTGNGGQGLQGKGSKMQQVAVTYDAAAYDEEEKNSDPHRPQKLVITTSEEAGEGAGVKVGGSVPAGSLPVTIDVGGGGGTIQSRIHTESAELTLDNDDDSTLVEDWLRGRGDFPATDALPSPSDAARPLNDDAGPVERLLHDRAKLSRLDYEANTDWWNASLGIGFGVSAGQVTLGFKLFGIDITHEHKEQTITGDPTYATAPQKGGGRPWVEWKNCTRTTPVPV